MKILLVNPNMAWNNLERFEMPFKINEIKIWQINQISEPNDQWKMI